MSPPSKETFQRRLAAVAAATEAALAEALTAAPLPGEITRPERLLLAMRHATLGGGKRLRPFLVIECAALFGVPQAQAMGAAAAIECVHCYSLVHDDLPAMDDDELRRGQPTVHRAFDEATAILAGDALLTLAFEIISHEMTDPDPAIRIALTRLLASASGVGGMAGGQMFDLESEGRFAGGIPLVLVPEEIDRLQAMKTGALIQAACEAGAILGRADAKAREALNRYARALGLAFQIADDFIDAEGETAAAGKQVGKDKARGKATFVSSLGTDGAHKRLQELVREAEAALMPFGTRGAMLAACARFVAERRA
ncbi:MAG TPA: farnesyl diphosphate synthase [Xanthobacteraceae bacterium]|jgi:farnesyl diphosphate synthase